MPLAIGSIQEYFWMLYEQKGRGQYIGQCAAWMVITHEDKRLYPELRDKNEAHLFWDGRDENREPVRLQVEFS